MARITYKYTKGQEDRNRLFIVANNGNFDNTVGVSDAYSLSEGGNVIDVKFGLFRSAESDLETPYTSSFITLEVKGVDEKSNTYINPQFVNLSFVYKRDWFRVQALPK